MRFEVFAVLQRIGQLVRRGNIAPAAPHEALDRGNGVGGILLQIGDGVVANLASAALGIAHDRGQQHPALRVGQAFGHTIAHRGHQRMRGAQVNTYRQAPLVGLGGLAGFGDLQQRHGILS